MTQEEGPCGSLVYVHVSVYLSIAMLAATYHIHTSKMKRHRVVCAVFKICMVWILQKML